MLYKTDGWGGSVTVRAINCKWNRETITYTKSLKFTGPRCSTGTSSMFNPSSDKYSKKPNSYYTSFKLKGDVLQRARTSGDHICLQVTGGSSKVTFASEMTGKPPKLVMMIKPTKKKMRYSTQGKKKQSGKAKDKKAAEMDAAHGSLVKALTKKETNKILDAKKAKLKMTLKAIKERFAGSQSADLAKRALEPKMVKKKIEEKRKSILAADQARMQKTARDSGLSGKALADLKARLKRQASVDVFKKQAEAVKEVEADIAAKGGSENAKVAAQVEHSKVKSKEAVARATKEASELTAGEKAKVKREVDAAVPVQMALYMKKKATGENRPKKVKLATGSASKTQPTKAATKVEKASETAYQMKVKKQEKQAGGGQLRETGDMVTLNDVDEQYQDPVHIL